MSERPATQTPQEEPRSRAMLDYHDGYLCVMTENNVGARGPNGPFAVAREWYPLHKMSETEAKPFTGRPLTGIDPDQGLYVDDEGQSFQLSNKGTTRPIDSKTIPTATDGHSTGLSEVAQKSSRKSRRKVSTQRERPQLEFPTEGAKARPATRRASADRTEGDASDARLSTTPRAPRQKGSARVNPSTLAQRLTEVRSRIGYIQKRGHNELFGYSYAMAADIAGAVGDALAELGVIVIPHLESITSEPLPAARERIVRVVMDYTLVDSQTGERETIRVAGEGRDPGDKGPYKAMTGALKYALLQTFLIATGDDPENERGEGGESVRTPALATIGPEKARQLGELLTQTGTEVERVLEYFKVGRLEDLTESAHRKALQILNRRRARNAGKEAHHAEG